MGHWPERALGAALPKSMPETARLSVFEKENGNDPARKMRRATDARALCASIHARFDSHGVETGILFCFLPSSVVRFFPFLSFSPRHRRCP